MTIRRAAILFLGMALGATVGTTIGTTGARARMHDDEIRRMIVADSLARYGGDCPCPYSYAWNGKQCANDSAYMKRVPNAPLCYPQDVHWRDVEQYRRERGL